MSEPSAHGLPATATAALQEARCIINPEDCTLQHDHGEAAACKELQALWVAGSEPAADNNAAEAETEAEDGDAEEMDDEYDRAADQELLTTESEVGDDNNDEN